MSTSTIPLAHGVANEEWSLPYHGTVAMLALIVAETAIFTIFVVAYIYYIGKSISGPQPRQVLELPDLQYRLPAVQQLHHLDCGACPEKKFDGSVQLVVGHHRACWARSFSAAPGSNGRS